MQNPNKVYVVVVLLNTALLIGCIVYLLLGNSPNNTSARFLDNNENVSVRSDGSSQEIKPRIRGQGGLAGLFADVMEPVKRAALDHQADPSLFLPSEEELSLAIASESLDSEESEVVFDILKIGYAEYNMPFPSLGAPPPAGDSMTRKGDPKEVQAWMNPTIQRLKEEAKTRGQEALIQEFIPTEEEQESAIEGGGFEAEEFQIVQQKIQEGYRRLEIPFPAPGQSHAVQDPMTPRGDNYLDPQSTGRENVSAEKIAEKQIINAYFQGQLQRIKLEAKKQDEDVSGCYPSTEKIQDAVQSGAISSDDSLSVISLLEGCYDRLDIPFHPPVRQ